MKRKKSQAPSTHGPGVLTEGAQKPRLEGSSIEQPPSMNKGPSITAQVKDKFNPDLWREQALDDEGINAEQLFLLLLLSYKFDEQGKLLSSNGLDAMKVKFSKELTDKNFNLLESRGWFKSRNIDAHTEYVALRGWTDV